MFKIDNMNVVGPRSSTIYHPIPGADCGTASIVAVGVYEGLVTVSTVVIDGCNLNPIGGGIINRA